ncbi:uncharacterized protein LTR77_010623 [Saxophila tyrrhenica]|uniref:Sulfotransferase n=1 Tax=Saxophila tyrrhenica TaxID=1690608 RepID=A0AAV9NX93_9PEZI|nr:hypothetical protein LTR77_010623 [Saxophila tyrrhenica]
MAVSTPTGNSPLRVVVFDNLRVRSHLFARLFSEHPRFSQIYHPFMMAGFLGPEGVLPKLRHSETRSKELAEDWQPLWVTDTHGSCRRQLEDDVARVEAAGKNIWVNEHSCLAIRQEVALAHLRGHQYTPQDLGPNPTYCPDWLFDTCTPMMVIRHPALSVRSLYDMAIQVQKVRPTDEDFVMCTSLHFCRLLFDLFKSQGRTPIVADGEDVVLRRKGMTDGVCEALGIDPDGVVEQWDPTPLDQRPQHPMIAAFTKTIHESHGIEFPNENNKPVDVETVLDTLVERYGEDLAAELKRHIDLSTPDYQYMKQFAV